MHWLKKKPFIIAIIAINPREVGVINHLNHLSYLLLRRDIEMLPESVVGQIMAQLSRDTAERLRKSCVFKGMVDLGWGYDITILI